MSTVIRRFKSTQLYQQISQNYYDWEARLIVGLVQDIEDAAQLSSDRDKIGSYYSLLFQVFEIFTWGNAQTNYIDIIQTLNRVTRQTYDIQFLVFYKYSITSTANNNFMSPIW